MKKFCKSILSLAIALIMVFGAGTAVVTNTGVNAFGVVAEAASVKISAKTKTVYYGSSVTLKVLNTKKKVTWTTGNKNIATVTSKGKVTGKNLGSTYIYAKVSGKKYKCKVTVKDRNQSATRSFTVNGGGYFVKGESTAKVSVKAPKYAAAKGYVYIQNSAGSTVYSKTYTKMAKGKTYSFNWNGKNSKGSYVPAGSYRVLVKLGTTKAASGYLKFIAKNDFANGNGSKTNPFEVATTAQLQKIVKYSTASFKQTANLDFGYESVGGFFSEDQQFNGTYEGNGKTISNIAGTEALFEYVGAKGTIKNLKMTGCSVVGNEQALLAKYNYGKIMNCDVNGVVSVSGNGGVRAGLMVLDNMGKISDCITSGDISVTGARGFHGNAVAGGMVSNNLGTGKIISSMSYVNVTTIQKGYDAAYAGGVSGINNGVITGCEANGKVEASTAGGIVGYNNTQIIDCYYTGTSSVNIAGANSGAIV